MQRKTSRKTVKFDGRSICSCVAPIQKATLDFWRIGLMNKFWTTTILALIIVGGTWVLINHEKIEQSGGVVAFLKQSFPAIDATNNSSAPLNSNLQNGVFQQASDPRFSGRPNMDSADRNQVTLNASVANRIRIASFKLSGASSHPNPQLAMQVMADICRRHDLIAFQEVDGHRPGWLDELAAEIARQSSGRAVYRHAGDHIRVTRNEPQYAFLYNAATLELDLGHTYTVADPDNVLVREPLVGWFRARQARPEEAFTFTVANIQLDREHPGNELAYLGNLYSAIRSDGRGEDDVIFVGDFKSGDRALAETQKKFGMTWVVSDTATNTMKDAQYDNLVFNEMATLEFTGNGGVVDFLKLYNLGFRDAMAISEHMPVWAEFSAVEAIR